MPGLLDRIDARLAGADSLGIADLAGRVDFTLAFAVVHEMPSASQFFAEVALASKPGAHVLFAEPAGHVSQEFFEEEIDAAAKAGLVVVNSLAVKHSTRSRESMSLVGRRTESAGSVDPIATRPALRGHPAHLAPPVQSNAAEQPG